MALNLVYPTNTELMQIERDKIPLLTTQRPIFDIMPMRNLDSGMLMWEQKDNYTGLQQVRGINGQPPRVKKEGVKRYIMQPGYYGEFETVDELEITLRRPVGSFSGSMNIDDLVLNCQDKLLGRRLDRIEYIGWTLICTGTFSVPSVQNVVLHTDTYATQTFTASPTWATVATATPLADFRAVQILSRGHSVSFGAGAKAYMNQGTFNSLISNTNTADLFGRRSSGLSTINNLQQLNELLAGDGLPTIVIYDMGYLNDSGVFQKWIPDNRVAVIGVRPGGQVLAEYLMTRNANNPNAEAGPYTKIVDDPDEVPRNIEVHDGHNGGPAIYFPSAIVVMTV